MTQLRWSHRRRLEFWRGWTYGIVVGIGGAPVVLLAIFRLF